MRWKEVVLWLRNDRSFFFPFCDSSHSQLLEIYSLFFVSFIALMGTSVSSNTTGITIILTNRPTDDPFYWAGDYVEGVIKFIDTQHLSELKLIEASVKLIGELVCTTTSRISTVHYLPFFTAKHNLLSPLAQVGQGKIA